MTAMVTVGDVVVVMVSARRGAIDSLMKTSHCVGAVVAGYGLRRES